MSSSTYKLGFMLLSGCRLLGIRVVIPANYHATVLVAQSVSATRRDGDARRGRRANEARLCTWPFPASKADSTSEFRPTSVSSPSLPTLHPSTMNLRPRTTILHHTRRLCRPAAPTAFSARIRILVLPGAGAQTFATHANVNTSPSAGAGSSSNRPTSASLLSNALDRTQRGARREDSAGPFTLGITPPRPDEVKPEKKWSELSAAGKGASISFILIHRLY